MKKILLLLISVALNLTALSQSKEIDAKLKGLDAVIEKSMKDWNVPGLSVAIVYKNNVVLAKGYGYRNKEQKLPATAETLFAIGSCSKAFTAADVCILQEDGKLELDKPLRTYLPDFKMYDDYVSENMTARDLLCHRSGLPRHDLVWYGADFTRQELYDRLRYLEPSKPFRTTYQYQNLMFLTAGYLVEKVSNKTWEVFTKEKILLPLEMKASNFSITDLQKANDFSNGYADNSGLATVIPYMNIDAMGPAGSINSNANDMSHWLLALINGGKYKGKKVLSENIIRQVQTPTMVAPAQVPLQYDETSYNMYGLGWMITSYRGHIRVEHGGNIDGFSASTCFMPKDSIGVVVLTNLNGTSAPSVIRNTILDRMLGLPAVDWSTRLMNDRKKALASEASMKKEDDLNRVKDTTPSHRLESYVGSFENSGYGIIEIRQIGDQLHADFHSIKTPLDHYHYDIFKPSDKRFENTKIAFTYNQKGDIDQLSMKLEATVKDIVFTRKLVPAEVAESTLALYVGDYSFGGENTKVYTKGGKTLYLFVPGQPEYELVAVKEHEFKIKILDGFTVRFIVGTNGSVAELYSIQPNGTFKAKKK